jgi:uncharacterized glyoxalase superfamily protein PhnB
MIEVKNSFPVFTVENLTAAKSFYRDNFGFELVFSGDWYIHLVSKSGVQVGFLLPDQPTQPPFFHKAYSGDGVIFSLEVEDAEVAFDIAWSQSLKVVLELRTEEWGRKHFCVQDPNGVIVDIVQCFEPTEAYQSDYTSK